MSEEVEEVEIKDPKAVLDALERAKADAKKYREEAEALKSEVETLKTTLEQPNEWKDRTRDLMIKQELGTGADRLMKFIDMDSITFNDDGDLEGVTEAVAKVKADLPELFDSKRRVGGAADLYEKGETPVRPTGTEAQVSRLMRKR